MSLILDPSQEDLDNNLKIVTKELDKDPTKIEKFINQQMVSYGGPEKALEKLKNTQDMSRTPKFFRKWFGKLLANAMQEIKKKGFDPKIIDVFNSLLEKSNTTKKIEGGRIRRRKTFRKKQQLVGGSKALTTLIIFLVTICYMASALNSKSTFRQPMTPLERYTGNMTTSKLYDGFGEITRNGKTYTTKFENGKSGDVGIINYPNQTTFVGQIKNFEPNGYGEFVKDGIHYKGLFNNEYEGMGSFETPEYSYIGEFKDFQPNGYGQKTTNTGKVLVGMFKNGVPEGFGSVKENNIERKGKFDGDNILRYSYAQDIISTKTAADEKQANEIIKQVNDQIITQINKHMRDVDREVEDAKKIQDDFEKQERMKENEGNMKKQQGYAETERKKQLMYAASICIPLLIILVGAGTKRHYDKKRIASQAPPSNPDYLAIVLISCKTLFFDGSQKIMIKREGWTGESYQSYSYEMFLKDVNEIQGNRISAALDLLSKCKIDGSDLSENTFLKQIKNIDNEEEIVHAFLDELSQMQTKTKGGAYQIIKKSPLQKRNAKTTQKNKLRARARSRSSIS